MGANQSCPGANTTISENGAQWSLSSGKWSNVKLGWLIAGLSTLLTSVLCIYATYRHARNYHRPKEQRQIIRIIWMPWVFSIISFFAYRYYRKYIYYKLVIIVYESFCLTAFLALMLAYIGSSTEGQMKVMQSKDKRPLPWPLGCIRYRPSKPYFLYALNGSVLQYAFVRPAISIIAMVCEAGKVLCAHKFSIYYANLYLEVVDFTSISIALYGLVVLYTLVKERLEGRRPMTKFVLIKVVVALTYYQAFLFSALASNGVIKANAYWSKSNISDGLNAIVICVEMVFVSGLMFWAYPAGEYIALTKGGEIPPTGPWRALGQALNFGDFVMEGWRGLLFFKNWWQNRRKANKAGIVEEQKPDEDCDRPTNLNAYQAFNGPPRPRSAIASKFEMSAVDAAANRGHLHSLVYQQSIDSPRAGSYLEMDEDFEHKEQARTGRRSGFFGGKSPNTMPNSPSSFRPSSLSRTSFSRPPTAFIKALEETNSVRYEQPSSPVYRSLLGPNNLTSPSRPVTDKVLPTPSEGPSRREGSVGMVPAPVSAPIAPMKSAISINERPLSKASLQHQTSRDATQEQKLEISSPALDDDEDEDKRVTQALQYNASGRMDATPEGSQPDHLKPPLNLPGSRKSEISAGSFTRARDPPELPTMPEHDDQSNGIQDRPKVASLIALTLPETGQFSPLRF